MYRLVLVAAILIVACKHPQTPVMSEHVVDSLIDDLHDSVQPEILRNNFPAANNYLDGSLARVSKSGDARLISSWALDKGIVCLANQDYDSAKLYLYKALKDAERIPSQKYLIDPKINLGKLYARQKEYDSALKFGLEAYKLSKELDTSSLANVCIILNEIYYRMGDTAARKKYLFEGYKYSRGKKNQFQYATNIAEYYFTVGERDSAKVFYTRMLKEAKNDTSNYYDARINLLENMGAMLTLQGQLDKGLEYLREGVEQRKKYHEPSPLIYLNLAENFHLRNKITKAILYNDTALEIARSQGDFTNMANALENIASYLYYQNKFKEGYGMLDSCMYFYVKGDSVSFIKQAQELETRFAAKDKDQKIATLAFENEVNRKIENQQRVIIIAIAVAFVFLALAAIFFWRRRQLQARLRETELTQQLLTSQMEPHFLFNMMATLQSYIRSGADKIKVDQYFQKFSLLLRSILENARETFVPLQSEISIVESYLSLQALQSNESFQFRIEGYKGDESDQVYVPSMLLQPFAENAILHGIANRGKEGLIKITVSRVGRSIEYKIEDNGHGIQETPNKDTSRLHAIDLIRQRLILLHRKSGVQTNLEILNNDIGGVTVFISVPFFEEN